MRKWPAEPGTVAQSGRGTSGLPRVSPLWQPVPEVFSTVAGMHRVVWRPVEPAGPAGPGGGSRRGGGARLTGTVTTPFTVHRRAFTQTFVGRPDPRSETH